MPESALIGHTLVETELGEEYGLNVVGIVRDGKTRLGYMPNAHCAEKTC